MKTIVACSFVEKDLLNGVKIKQNSKLIKRYMFDRFVTLKVLSLGH